MAANQLLTVSDITQEIARILKNNTVLIKGFNRQYEDRFAVEGRKAGDTINIRLPAQYKGRRGEQVDIEGSRERYVPLTLDPLYGVDMEFNLTDSTLSISDMPGISERFLKPAAISLANQLDVAAAAQYKNVYNMVGTPGTTPATSALILAAGQRLDEEAAPVDDERSMIVNPAAQAGLVEGLKGLYNPQGTISSQFKRGRMGDGVLGFNFAMDQNIATHTSGTAYGTGTPTLTAAPANGATTLAVTAFGANTTLARGDIIKLTGIYAVNPQNKQRNSYERTVVVTADITLNGSGAGTVSISPALWYSGAQQNISAQPASNNAIAVVSAIAASGIYPQNLAFHKDAFTFASVGLKKPAANAVDSSTIVVDGISISVKTGYIIGTNQEITRLDVLGGFATVFPELAVRVAG